MARPKPNKPSSNIPNSELRKILENVSNDLKAEVAKIFKDHQKASAKKDEVPQDQLFDFGVKLLNKLDEFIEQNKLDKFVDCFSLQGQSYDTLFKKRENKKDFVGRRVAKSKGNFYNDIASGFAIDRYRIERFFSRDTIEIITVPMIVNKELFEVEVKETPRRIYSEYSSFSDLKDQIISRIEVNQENEDEIIFHTNIGKYRMYHSQDCCESVGIEEIIGDVEDLYDSPVLIAEEVSKNDEDASESGTWTFYKLSTVKGSVTVRWYGSSNGYYSESVSFEKME